MSASATRQNNIGFIRLLAALMVIVAHAPEMVDGNRSREPLTRWFGTMTFGDLGVDIFFLISGYLITKSYLSTGTGSYLLKRVLRIYPGYLVAYLICIVLVAPLAGVSLSSLSMGDCAGAAYHASWLDMPRLRGVFLTEHYHTLNGSMWTISYEFRCYLFVVLAGVLGFYKRRTLFLVLPAMLLFLQYVILTDPYVASPALSRLKEILIGDPVELIRFMFVFTCGAAFWLFQNKIRYRGAWALACLPFLVVAMFWDKTAEPAICTLGAYCLFYCAFKAKQININRDYDFSYGVYLYAWPIAALIVQHQPAVNLVWLACITFVLSLGAGAASWYLIEKPATSLSRRLPKPALTATVTT